jgi:hypothetical protein
VCRPLSRPAGRIINGHHHFTVTFPPVVFSGDMTGTAVFISNVGDCVTTPLTRTTVVFTVHIT